jgi:hypothetical protein
MALNMTSVRYVGGRKDNRRSRRIAINDRGYIRPDGGFAKWPCTVLDASETGIRLKLEGNHAVPTMFNYVAVSGGMGRAARVKWRRGQEVGAEFIQQ